MRRFWFLIMVALPLLVSGATSLRGDFTGDGRVSIADLARLIQAIQSGEANRQYVDLGLPSGTLWATFNVGATAPEGYGGYYAWGETMEKNTYYWSTYTDAKGGNQFAMQTYKAENLTSCIGTADDVARVLWGDCWQLPSLTQQEELRKHCVWRATVVNGVNCVRITGDNGQSIIMPKAGYRIGTKTDKVGEQFYYWSGDLLCAYDPDAYSTSGACMNDAFTSAFPVNSRSRYYGQPVRAVVAPGAVFTDFDLNEDGAVNQADIDTLVLLLLQPSNP